MHPAEVDWGSTRVIVMLCVLAVFIPIYLTTFVLLFQRRKLYPIAGRGIAALLGLGIVCFVATMFNAASHIAFPDGQPCGVHAFILWFTSPFGVIMLIRAWTLMFNLGIQNFLTELSWRQTKRAKLLAREAEASTIGAQGGGGSVVVSRVSGGMQLPSPSAAGAGKLARGGSTVIRIESASDAVSPHLSMPSLDPTTIPGYFFVTHRHWTRVGNVLLVMSGFSLLIAMMVILIMVYDPDVGFTNRWRRDHGYPDLNMDSQLTPNTFFHSPRCFWYSIKTWSFIFASAIANPYVAMIAVFIRAHNIRAEKRAKEQAEFAKAIREIDGNTGGGNPGSGVQSLTASTSGPAASAAGGASLELDEFSAVKLEIGVGLNCASIGLLLYMLMTGLGGYNWTNLVIVIMYFTFFLGSCVQPLWISFVTSKRFKIMMARARAETKGGAGGKGKGGKIVAQIAHHRPLYRLAHIISDTTCYPYLLAFLQKEYSSENALFWHEARNFARAARTAETQITGWTSHLDEDDGGSVLETQFHVNQSQIHAARSPAATSQIHVKSTMSPGVQPVSAVGASPPPVPMQAFSLPEPAIPMLPSSGANANATGAARRRTDSPQMSPVLRDSPQGSPLSGPMLARQQSTSSAPAISPAGSVVLMTPPRPKMLVRVESSAVAPSESPVGGRSSSLVKSSSTLSLHLPSGKPSAAAAAVAPALTFREMHDVAARSRAWSLQLYADYLKPAAVYQINIDSDLAKMVSSMVRQLDNWNPSPDPEQIDTAPPVPPPFPLSSLYKQTALSVFNLMETDSFRRFLLTADFQTLLQRADDQEMERLERQPGVAASLASTLAKADEALKLAVAGDDGAVMLPGTPQQSPGGAAPGFSRVKSQVPISKLQAQPLIFEEEADTEISN